MNDRELRRPSTWLISMCLAFAYLAVRVLADIEAGREMMPTAFYFWAWVLVWSTTMAGISSVYGLLLFVMLLPRLLDAVLATLAKLFPKKPAALHPAPDLPKVVIQREVTGEAGRPNHRYPTSFMVEDERPARWVAWQQTALEVMAWYRITGSLIYSVMAGAGKAFKKNQDAQTVYEEMDRLGLVTLVNGRATVLADSIPSVMAALRGGKLEWTTEKDPPAIRPAPLRGDRQPAGEPQSTKVIEG